MKKSEWIILVVIVVLLMLVIPFDIPEAEDSISGDEELSESYPLHPTLEDCEKTKRKNFCLDDVAEITNNISICYEIADSDVKKMCIGRISLNETMCMEVESEGLREACLESVALKRAWAEAGRG